MSFDAFPFWIFVLTVWALWLLAGFVRRGNVVRSVLLLMASYAYYATWNPRYLLLLAGFTLLSFWIGRVAVNGVGFPWMLAGASICVAGLGYAKIWMSPLPVGVSFYALQAISYIADRYRGDLVRVPGLLGHSLYMSFFPRLPAGPIVRAGEFLPQLEKGRSITSADVWEALVLICFGLFKKLAIADNLAAVADPVFNDLHVSSSRILLATYAFAVQIYCDFSGYTDMALGVARLFGYRLPDNFNWPYLARNPADFWRRWHITLSNWLRDYVYFSLPGNRSSNRGFSYLNFVVTMLICGIWHGLGWTFIAWGFYQGLLLAGYYAIRPQGARATQKLTLSSTASILLMQQLSVAGWILFRLNHISDLPAYLAGLLQNPLFSGFAPAEWMALAILALVILAHLVELAVPITTTALKKRWDPWVLGCLLTALMIATVYSVPKQQLFFYFRF